MFYAVAFALVVTIAVFAVVVDVASHTDNCDRCGCTLW